MPLLAYDDCGDTYGTNDKTMQGWHSNTPGSMEAGRIAGNCITLGGTSASLRKPFSTPSSDFTHHSAFRANSQNGTSVILVSFQETATTHVDVRMNASGGLTVTRNGTVLASTTGVILLTGAWYQLEVRVVIHDSAGIMVVKLNGVEVINISGVDTRNAMTGVCEAVTISGGSTNNPTISHDDLHVWSGEDFHGDTKVRGQVMVDDGSHTDFTPSSGVDHSAMVDDPTIDSDSTYVSTTVADSMDTYLIPDLGVGDDSLVFAVIPFVVARKDDVGTRTLKTVLVVDGNNFFSTDIGLSTSYLRLAGDPYYVNPDTTDPWTVAEVEAAEYGFVDTTV